MIVNCDGTFLFHFAIAMELIDGEWGANKTLDCQGKLQMLYRIIQEI